MKALCLVTEQPYPPRNGITIPTSNQINVLKNSGHQIIIINMEDLTEDTKLSIPLRSRMINELTGREAFFTIHYSKDFIRNKLKVNGPFDIIYYSPISLYQVALDFNNFHYEIYGKRAKIIASISDCYTSVLESKRHRDNIALKQLPNIIRSLYMGKYESEILNQADIVFVQTQRDKEWVKKIGTKTDVLIYTNGVNDKLFSINNQFNKNLVFVANLKDEYYQDKLKWFLNNCWANILKAHSDVTLYVYAGGMVSNLHNIKAKNVILVNEFVEDITDIYQGKAIAIAPIFKKFGFINKVAEAMASGLVVIGDESAFNGMNDIDSSLFSNDAKSFTSNIINLLDDSEVWYSYHNNFKNYALKHFSWSSRNKGFENFLNTLK